jgi:hypothetical protein
MMIRFYVWRCVVPATGDPAQGSFIRDDAGRSAARQRKSSPVDHRPQWRLARAIGRVKIRWNCVTGRGNAASNSRYRLLICGFPEAALRADNVVFAWPCGRLA